jgi:hypothetical protein
VTATAPTVEPTRAPAPAWSRSWRRVGWVLLICWVLLVPTSLLQGERASSLTDLEAHVAAAEVDAVRVAGGLSGDRGYSVVEVHWRRGLFGYSTEVVEARPRRAAPPLASREGATAVITEDLGDRLTALQPGLRVDHVGRTEVSATFLGWWQLREWLVPVFLLLMLATLLLLVHGPRPWRATRWAWFWLMVMTPVGTLAYLVLAGPTTLVAAPRDRSRRLTGGWAFLLALVVGSAVSTGS